MYDFNNFFDYALSKRKDSENLRQLQQFQLKDTLHFTLNGKQYVNFSTNDYLGLACDSRLKRLSKHYLDQWGIGYAASRLITGNSNCYSELERGLANYLGAEATLIFASGWQANVAVLSSLLENLPKPVWVITDKFNHASLHYGCKLAQSKQIRFRHNDMDHLRHRLLSIQSEKGSRLIVTETLFSMDGDLLDLPTIRQISDEFKAFLYLDDAHATGVYGKHGKGLAPGYADLIMGTFSKAWGGFGAYVAGSKSLCDWLINFCSGFIHTTAIPPSVIGAIAGALETMPLLEHKRILLKNYSQKVLTTLNAMGILTGTCNSYIIPLMTHDSKLALNWSAYLKNQGIWIPPIRYPTVAKNASRLRLTLSAAHQEHEIEHLLDVIQKSLHVFPQLKQN
ncbi:8-amino-7-oxononanoate synthase 2 [Commensalibacter sp. Nvir]|uniref:aminotransferase class I/II-fold pyridoxal phosphate-dependent enzyme n=1 Tax=Commensalibacter sp. Nvir TaxID=3069817 RepID=UPI002D3567A3|nr:8-amino-7-oxononanoate synthase 2 [Commensalibacter sp. Nvir]